jgi:hypothetical protein
MVSHWMQGFAVGAKCKVTFDWHFFWTARSFAFCQASALKTPAALRRCGNSAHLALKRPRSWQKALFQSHDSSEQPLLLPFHISFKQHRQISRFLRSEGSVKSAGPRYLEQILLSPGPITPLRKTVRHFISREMPGVPSSKGCDACRRVKKKVQTAPWAHEWVC